MNSPSDIYQGLHILLLTEDDTRSKALTKVLRDHKARVGELKASARDPGALRGVDVALVDVRHEAAAQARLNELREDVRARFASVIKVDYESLVKSDGSVQMSALQDHVWPEVAADRQLTERARAEQNFSTKLSPLGPSRTLRALSVSGHTLLVELRHETLSASVEVSNELLVSASAARGEKRWEAWSALVRILGLSEAEVHVSRRSFTAAMNIMEPVDQALEVAAQERHCSAPQIADEEAEAVRLSQAPARAAAGAQTGTRDSLPARGASLNPGYTPPRPPGKPALGAQAAQRTLLGIRPGLPAISVAPAANDTLPPNAGPTIPVPRPNEGPRYAHRPGALGSQRPGMTLLGVAPGSIPGLAELRAQAEQAEKEAKAAQERARAEAEQEKASEQALATAITQAALRPVQVPAEPPSGRPVIGDQLLDTLGLDELTEDLTLEASPLSTPLPPPREQLPDSETPSEPASSLDDQDLMAETFPTPTDLRSQLIARSTDALAQTERPPAPSDEPPPASSEESAFDEPPTKNYPATLDVSALDQPEPRAPEPAGAGGEVTLVTKREPMPRKSRTGTLAVGAVGVALAGVLLYAMLRDHQVPAEPAVAARPAASTPVAAPAAPSEPVVAQPAPSEPAVPSAVEPAPTPEPVEPTPIEPTPVEPTPVEPVAAAAAPAPAPTEDFAGLLKQAQRTLAARDAAAAKPLFEQALAMDSANPHVREGLAESLLKLNEPSSALPQVQAAVKLRPKRARYQVLLGDVLAALGKLDDAQTAWKKALSLDANDADAKQRLAR